MTGAAAPTDLCIGCAMCCDGTLFDRVKYEDGEESKLAAGGLQSTSVEGKRYFLQPCAYEQCGRCTIYESRFEVCRSFDCRVLRDLKAGAIPADVARSRVSKALELRAAVTSSDGGAGVYAERQRLRKLLSEQLAKGDVAERGSTARRLLAMSALDAYLDRWFRTTKADPQG